MKTKNKNKSERLTLTVDEVAAKLGVHKNSVYKLITLGKLKPLPDFRHKIITPAELDRYLAQAA